MAARPARKASEGLLNDCFAQISDSSFDGGSGEEMVESTHKTRDAIVTGEVDNQVEISTQGMGKVGGPDLEADDLIGSSPSVSELKVSAKVLRYSFLFHTFINHCLINAEFIASISTLCLVGFLKHTHTLL